MVSSALPDLRVIDPMLLLECITPQNQPRMGKLLATEEIHMLVIFGCKEDHRFEYLEVGPGVGVRNLDAALALSRETHSPRFVVPTKTCPKDALPAGLPAAHAIPYALAKVVAMARADENKITLRSQVAPARSSPATSETTAKSPASVIAFAPAGSAVAVHPVSAPKPAAKNAVPSAPEFKALPEENPTDTLRRALHGVLATITDREASLNVREASVAELDESASTRARDFQAKLDSVSSREAAVTALEKSLSGREVILTEKEKNFTARDEELKTRKNSMAFREKSLAGREHEIESRVFDLNAREGALIPSEQALATRETAVAAREKDCKALVDAFAVEKARVDAEARTFYETLKSREDAVAAREKIVAAHEATFKAETAALLKALESMTTASRAIAGR